MSTSAERTREKACFGRADAFSNLFYILGLALAIGSPTCKAQDGKTLPITPDRPYTLHVYEDLVQVPSLVLTSLHGDYAGLDPANFFISLDSGPLFHPRHLRLEGDDPITVALLLDDSGDRVKTLAATADDAVAHLPIDLFGPQDRVSVFAFDCNLIRSISGQVASLSVIQAGITGALSTQALHEGEDHRPCHQPVQLWDAIGYVAKDTHGQPGRLVILVLSAGFDHGSFNTWKDIQEYAEAYSIAVFGLRSPVRAEASAAASMRSGGRMMIGNEDPFGMLCGGTGGLSMLTTPQTLTPIMERVFAMVRGRYILEFARPNNGTAGRHQIAVSLSDKSAVIRTSGVMVPVPDKALLSDPSTVPTDASRAPVMGSRKILTH